MILLLNGAFGIGKTTVARVLVTRLPRAVLYDPELIGIALQRIARMAGHDVEDFQDLRIWRRLTVIALRVVRLFRRNVIVPMAFSNPEYLEEIRDGITRFEPRHVHVCLVAPLEVVQQRLQNRRLDPRDAQWQYRRAAECCAVHHGQPFATQVDAANRDVNQIAAEIVQMLTA
ncbi:MAG TPA: AAA family ATPase [Thermoanaerobaculia bacterium]|jgi:hypothetical protein